MSIFNIQKFKCCPVSPQVYIVNEDLTNFFLTTVHRVKYKYSKSSCTKGSFGTQYVFPNYFLRFFIYYYYFKSIFTCDSWHSYIVMAVCMNTSFGKCSPTCLNDCPWLLFIVIVKQIDIGYCQLVEHKQPVWFILWHYMVYKDF